MDPVEWLAGQIRRLANRIRIWWRHLFPPHIPRARPRLVPLCQAAADCPCIRGQACWQVDPDSVVRG